MTLASRAWLPADIQAPPRLLDEVAALVGSWSERWFVADRFTLLGSFGRVAANRSTVASGACRALDANLALGLPAGGISDIGSVALSVGLSSRPAADVQLLSDVGRACLADLEKELSQLLHIPGGTWRDSTGGLGELPVYRVAIGAPDRAVSLTLDLSEQVFFEAVRRAVPKVGAAKPLGSAERALAAATVVLTAPLGRSAITISEYSGLAVGDILVLDRPVGALPLAINGRTTARGACVFTPGDNSVALEITEIPSP